MTDEDFFKRIDDLDTFGYYCELVYMAKRILLKEKIRKFINKFRKNNGK